MNQGLKKNIIREALVLLLLLGGGFLLVVMDGLRSRYPNINLGTASMQYVPTVLGEIGIILFLLYPVYLLLRLVIWGIKKGFKTWLLFFVLPVVCFFISGCYEVKDEIIPAKEAVHLDGMPAKYDPYTITPVAGGNDYRFTKPAGEDSPAESGSMRAIPLKDNIYIMQVKYDDYWSYMIFFMRLIDGESGKELKLVLPQTAIDPLKYDVDLKTHNLFNVTLTGGRKNILAFLKAHADADFTDGSPAAADNVKKFIDKALE